MPSSFRFRFRFGFGPKMKFHFGADFVFRLKRKTRFLQLLVFFCRLKLYE